MMSVRRASNEEARELPDDENRANLGVLKRGRTRHRDRSRDGLLGTHLRHPPIRADGSMASTGLTTHEAARLQTAQYTVTVEHEPEVPPHWVRVSFTLCLIILLVTATIVGGVEMMFNGGLTQLIESDPRAVLGVPWAGGAALVVVLLLGSSFGKTEFKVLGFEFKGASGPTVMWLLCFLAEALVIRVL
jgi:hypothetical protein